MVKRLNKLQKDVELEGQQGFKGHYEWHSNTGSDVADFLINVLSGISDAISGPKSKKIDKAQKDPHEPTPGKVYHDQPPGEKTHKPKVDRKKNKPRPKNLPDQPKQKKVDSGY